MQTFLCYSSHDRSAARALYNRLSVYTWLRTWFEFGTRQNLEEVVENSSVVILLLSRQSVSHKGYEEKHFTQTLKQIKEVKAQGKKRMLILPLRLDECTIPEHLLHLPWKDYFSVTAFEELINAIWVHQHEFTGPAIYATGGRSAAPESHQFPVEGPAAFYENLDWHKYVKIPESKEIGYSFLIRKFQVTTEQYFQFLQSDDYADKRFWIRFPKYDQHCNLIGDWGDEGFIWLKQVRKQYRSLLEKRRDWQWHFPSISVLSYDYRQPNHPAMRVTWFEANAYCKWLSAHWRELPEATGLSGLIEPNKNPVFRLPLETELHQALLSDDGTRLHVDPTGRRSASFRGIPIDYSEKDMLANLYGQNLKDRLAYCWGEFFIDQISKENYRLWDRGSFGPQEESEEIAFRVVITQP